MATTQNGFLRWLADAMRLLVRGAVPLGCVAALPLFTAVDQGRDVLRVLAEQTGGGAFQALTALVVASMLLALSAWYSLRYLLTANFPTLPLDPERAPLTRLWLPRIAGALVPAVFAIRFYCLGRTPGQDTAALAMAAVSAVVLLFFVMRRRLMPVKTMAELTTLIALPRSAKGVLVVSHVLSFALLLSFVLAPVTLPRLIGTAALLPLALAGLNLTGSFLLTYWPLQNGLPAGWPLILVSALGSGYFNDNHHVRTVSASAPIVDQRETPSARFLAWQHGQRPESAHTNYVVIATEGGGIRAAYWTAQVMEQLRAQIPGFDQRVFALSGVSGGSLGAATYFAQRRAATQASDGKVPDSCLSANTLAGDFLSPPVAGMLFGDLLQRFIPWPITALDRARGLEAAWQQALEKCDGNPFSKTLGALYAEDASPQLPSLLLNSTAVESGQRVVQSNLQSGDFTDSLDLMQPKFSVSQQPLAGLIHNSARFPVLSPAGTVVETVGDKSTSRYRLVDGGYFENSGTMTANDLVQSLQAAAVPGEAPAPRPVVIVLRNDYDGAPLCDEVRERGSVCRSKCFKLQPDKANPPSRIFPEASSILLGLLNVRSAHAHAARELTVGRTENLYHGQVYEIGLPGWEGVVLPPLGWELSTASRQTMEAYACLVVRQQAEGIAGALGLAAEKPEKCPPLPAVLGQDTTPPVAPVACPDRDAADTP